MRVPPFPPPRISSPPAAPTNTGLQICSKGFARADLLKRHRANHQDVNGPKRRRFNSVPSASRVAQACTSCAKARVKCEEIKPHVAIHAYLFVDPPY